MRGERDRTGEATGSTDDTTSVASPHILPPLGQSASRTSSSSFFPPGRQERSQTFVPAMSPNHTVASAVEDDVLHWQRSLHSEVLGSPRILLGTPTRRQQSDWSVSHSRTTDEARPDGAAIATQGGVSLLPPPTSPHTAAYPCYGGTDHRRVSPLRRLSRHDSGSGSSAHAERPSNCSTPHAHRGGAGDTWEDDVYLSTPVVRAREARHQAHTRKRLLNEDFFSGPLRKWRRDGRFPFKLCNTILIFICLLIQLSCFQLPETIANEQQRQAIIHHFTGSDVYLSRAKGNLVSRPTLFLDEQVQVFRSIEQFVDVYYNLTNTSVSELNYYYWQRDATDRDKLLRAYRALSDETGQAWANGEQVLQLLQEYQRRKRVKAYVRAKQGSANAASNNRNTPSGAAPINATNAFSASSSSSAAATWGRLSRVQPVVMQVLAYPFSLRERASPAHATPRWFTFLLDAANPLGPFRHYNRSHTQHRVQQAEVPEGPAKGGGRGAATKVRGDEEVRGGHKQYRPNTSLNWETSVLTDADLSSGGATVWSRRPTSSSGPSAQAAPEVPDEAFLQLVCHARRDWLTGWLYSPCRTPVISDADRGNSSATATASGAFSRADGADGGVTRDGGASPFLAFQGREGRRVLRRSAETSQGVTSDLLFSFMDNVVAVRLFASVRHLSMPMQSPRTTFFHSVPGLDTPTPGSTQSSSSSTSSSSSSPPRQRLLSRGDASHAALPFNRSVYRWMMEKNLRLHRGGLVEAELVVRTSVLRLHASYRHPAFLNALLLACLALWELYLRHRALARIHRYRRRVMLEKRRLRQRGHASHRGGGEAMTASHGLPPLQPGPRATGVVEEAAAERVRIGTAANLLDDPLSSSPSSSSIDRILDASPGDRRLDDDDEGQDSRRGEGAGVSDEEDDDQDEVVSGTLGWGPWARRTWWKLRIGIYEELGLDLSHLLAETEPANRSPTDAHATTTHPTRAAPPQGLSSPPGMDERQPLLLGTMPRQVSSHSSNSSPRLDRRSSSGAARALVLRRREEARQERLLARRYVSLRDSWRYQLQQSMGIGWHQLARLSAVFVLVYAVLYLTQLLPFPTGARADALRNLALGLACLSSSIVFLSYTRYFPRIYFPILITKVVIPRLLIFVLSIAPLFIGYALFFHIVFGSHSDGRFSTLGWSMMSLYFMAYGDSLLSAINTSERGASRAVAALANVMTVLFVLLFMMTILNFALGITIHEWHRIRQRFGTVMNMSSILFSVRTREEVKADALEKVRTHLELLLYMTHEDELAAAAAAAAAVYPGATSAAAVDQTWSPPSSHHRRRHGGRLADLALPPPVTTDAVDAPGARLSPRAASEEPESVQLSAATTIGHLAPEDFRAEGELVDEHRDGQSSQDDHRRREVPTSMSSLSDEL